MVVSLSIFSWAVHSSGVSNCIENITELQIISVKCFVKSNLSLTFETLTVILGKYYF